MNIPDLTEQSLTGAGVLDALLTTIKLHLDREFQEERIKGNEYANAYVQLVSAALNAAVQYAVSKPESEAKVADMEALRPSTVLASEKNVVKIETEKELIRAKLMTEIAQTMDVIEWTPGQPISVLGVIGKQKALYEEQKQGYVKDAIIKAAKIYADTAHLQLNVNENYTNGSNGLSDGHIATMMAKVSGAV